MYSKSQYVFLKYHHSYLLVYVTTLDCISMWEMPNVLIIVGIPLLVNAIILGIQNILEVLLEHIGILKMELAFLHTNLNSLLWIHIFSIGTPSIVQTTPT